MKPMYRRGSAAVIEDSAAAEAEFVRVTAISGSVPVAVVVRSDVVSAKATEPTGLGVGPAGVGPAGVGPAGVGRASVRRASVPACSQDPDLFFAESPVDVELAKSICLGCPARVACLAGAIERREPWGVWGGELFIRGEIVPRKRARGRPRKDEVAA
jgi:WhiB family redox-sensing transcriptional regulator